MQNRATLKLYLDELQYLQELLLKAAFMPECFGDLEHIIASAIHELKWQEAEYTWTNQE